MATAAVFRRRLQLIVLAAAATCSLAESNFINHTCEISFSQDFCVSMLLPDPQNINSSTVAELAFIALDIATADVSSTVEVFQEIANKNPGTELEAALIVCNQIYCNAGVDLADARNFVSSKSYTDADTYISIASSAPDDCRQTFVDVEMPPPVAERGEWLGERIDVCSALVKALINLK